jgi:hypothetical protein
MLTGPGQAVKQEPFVAWKPFKSQRPCARAGRCDQGEECVRAGDRGRGLADRRADAAGGDVPWGGVRSRGPTFRPPP